MALRMPESSEPKSEPSRANRLKNTKSGIRSPMASMRDCDHLVRLLNERADGGGTVAQDQQGDADGGAQKDDLQRVTVQERRDDIRGNDKRGGPPRSARGLRRRRRKWLFSASSRLLRRAFLYYVPQPAASQAVGSAGSGRFAAFRAAPCVSVHCISRKNNAQAKRLRIVGIVGHPWVEPQEGPCGN